MRRQTLWLFGIVTLLAFLASYGIALAEETDASSLSFLMTGTPAYGEKKVPVLSAVGEKACAFMLPGDTCRVIGHSGNFYQVQFQDKTGFVRKVALTLNGVQAELPAESESDLKLEDPVPTLSNAKHPVFKGTVRASKPLDSLYLFVWDARLMRLEAALFIPIASPAAEISASAMTRHLSINTLTGGRKILILEGSCQGETAVLFRAVCAVRAKCSEPASVTGMCRFSSPLALENNIKTNWKPENSQDALTVEIPPQAEARFMTLEWARPPISFTVDLYGEGDALLSSETFSTGFYADSCALTPDTRKAVIRFVSDDEKCGLICLRVYPEVYPEHAVQRWQALPDKVDLMAVSAHQDDELLFLGGTVASACAQGKTVAMVYMANCGRNRYREALDGMWTAGLRYHPIFLGWQDAKVESPSANFTMWQRNNGGEDPRVRIVRLIRQYRPDVIVTQDENGEYGHLQHILTAQLWMEAVHLSKDASFDPVSAEAYGAWDVKKMYVHLYSQDQITMDWDQPLPGNPAFTAIQLTKEAYSKHFSQQRAYSIDKHGKWYNNRLFGLYYTSVGPDEEKNDFFEHVSAP